MTGTAITSGTGTAPLAGTTPTTTTLAAGCTLRLKKVKLKKVKAKGVGRLTVRVTRRKGGKVRVDVKAAKATKQRVAKLVVTLDRKTLKRMHGKRLRRSFKLKRLRLGTHALKLTVRPRHGKRRIVKLTLRVTCR